MVNTLRDTVAFVLLTTLAMWSGYWLWRLHDSGAPISYQPAATVAPTLAPDPEDVRAHARRIRESIDHTGAGIYLRQAGQRDLAIDELRAALALDPGNALARQSLVEMGVIP